MGKTYRILSIDGGGIRGALSVALLQQLSAQPGLEGWLGQVDLIAGTSTGGLIALGLAKGMSLEEILKLYQERGKRIFYTSPMEKAFQALDPTKALDKIIYADYNTEDLEVELKDILGDVTLGELHKRVLITAFDLDNADPISLENDQADEKERRKRLGLRQWKPKLFHNIPGTDADDHVKAYKVGLYTSAAPTFFPVADGYVDGGVFASNPAMCALAQTRDARNAPEHRPGPDEVVLFSLGTGFSLQHIEGVKLDWGHIRWAIPLVSIMLDGVSGIAHYQCQQMLQERYARLAPVFPMGMTVGMDAIDQVDWMIEFAERIAEDRLPADDATTPDNAKHFKEAVSFLKTQWMSDGVA